MRPSGDNFHLSPHVGLSHVGFDHLRTQLVDLVEPLNDQQLLSLADGIHELLRQRRALRQHHVERLRHRLNEDPDFDI
ncbi:hypothetical protein [Brevundimonas nasdae]|uniref:hypothetical protein n=1 Tax=Brevundimonas nasdae TaxID=172043 RepID=UPI003F68FB0A